MTALIVGGDEISRSGCASIISGIDAIDLPSLSQKLLDTNWIFGHKDINLVIILGWSINIESAVLSLKARFIAPRMVLIYPPSTIECDSLYCRKGVELGFAGIVSAASDPSVLRAVVESFSESDSTRSGWRGEIDVGANTIDAFTRRNLEAVDQAEP
jgi:hypothetical protein